MCRACSVALVRTGRAQQREVRRWASGCQLSSAQSLLWQKGRHTLQRHAKRSRNGRCPGRHRRRRFRPCSSESVRRWAVSLADGQLSLECAAATAARAEISNRHRGFKRIYDSPRRCRERVRAKVMTPFRYFSPVSPSATPSFSSPHGLDAQLAHAALSLCAPSQNTQRLVRLFQLAIDVEQRGVRGRPVSSSTDAASRALTMASATSSATRAACSLPARPSLSEVRCSRPHRGQR